MLIAQAKKKENIIEYILYMYQIEDIIRSLKLDMDVIKSLIVDQFDQEESVKQKIYEWYINLCRAMIQEGKVETGHLNELVQLVKELQQFHTSVLNDSKNEDYKKAYEAAKPIMKDLVMKSGGKRLINEIDVALNGVYGYLVLKLKNTPISSETQAGIQKLNEFLAQLAFLYQKKD